MGTKPSVLVIGSREELGLERLAENFKTNGYDVRVIEPSPDALQEAYAAPFDGIVNFANGILADPIVRKNPDVVQIHRVDTQWVVHKGITQSTRIEEIFNEAIFWMGSKGQTHSHIPGMYERRLGFLQQRVREEPESAVAHYELAMAFKEKGEYANAFKGFRDSLAHNPQHVDALCELLEVVQNHPECLRELEQKDNFFTRLFKRVERSSEMEERRAAIDELEKIISRHHTHPEPFVYLGELRLEVDDRPGAYRAYRESVVRSGSVTLEQVLRSTGVSDDALRDAAFGAQIFSARIKRLFPKKWNIGNIVLKVYEQHDAQRARFESALLDSAAPYLSELTMPDGTPIVMPRESLVLTDSADTKLIHRMTRIPGKNAYFDLERLEGQNRRSLLEKLCVAAGRLDYFLTDVLSKRDVAVKALIRDERKGFISRRVSLRADHCPHNNLISYRGDRLSDSPQAFIERCGIGRVDFENDELCYSIWDLINLIELPGAEAEREDVFPLVLTYAVTRLNAVRGDGKEAKTLNELLRDKMPGQHHYSIFNDYVAARDPAFGSGAVPPSTKLRLQFLGLRFLRHLELTGLKIRHERDCSLLLDEMRKRRSHQLADDQDIVTSYLGTEGWNEQEQMDMLYYKLQHFKKTLYAQRTFHLERAEDSLKRLARDWPTEFNELYWTMSKYLKNTDELRMPGARSAYAKLAT